MTAAGGSGTLDAMAFNTCPGNREKELRRIENLDRRGLATFEELQRAHDIRRALANAEFDRQEAAREQAQRRSNPELR